MNARLVLFAAVWSVCVVSWACSSEAPRREAASTIATWMQDALSGSRKVAAPVVGLEVRRQDYGSFGRGRSCIDTPMRIGEKPYSHGLGTHSTSEIVVHLPEPAARLETDIGVDNDRNTFGREGTVVFVVETGGKGLYRSATRRGSDPPLPVRVELGGAREFTLRLLDAGDGPSCDHGDWAGASVVLTNGKRLWLDELPMVLPGGRFAASLPFSMKIGGRPSVEPPARWRRSELPAQPAERKTGRGDGRTVRVTRFTDTASSLVVDCEATFFAEADAVDWVLRVRNTGAVDSPLIENLLPLDLDVSTLPAGEATLRYAAGSNAAPSDYQPLAQSLTVGTPAIVAPVGGRSSNIRLPFFNLDWGDGGLIGAIGWSGQWQLRAERMQGGRVRLQAGQQTTRFVLRPGESVRTPRILLVGWTGRAIDGHNALRRLIYRHYTPLLAGVKPLPPTQCNTWFPVGDDGGKATAANQIALLEAYRPLGVEYLVMDAGWYGNTPNWAENAGSWSPRKDTFPQGLKPVGEAAKKAGIRFGMWFEPERVCPGTTLDRQHPEWLLRPDPKGARLLDLGRREAQQWFIDMVAGYIDSVPLGYFRHDFNMDPLPYWQKADAPDRQGICENRYVEGLYAVWDTLLARYPNVLFEGCASGGRRTDLESLGRCHTYWKSDLYGYLAANQAHVSGASLYLPGNYLNTPLFDLSDTPLYAPSPEHETAAYRMPSDPYAFRSLLGGALCAGWDPRTAGFPAAAARARVERFKALRHLAVGDFYPLLPWTLQTDAWIGYQFHRADLGEGLILLFRREKSPYSAVDVRVEGIAADAVYEVRDDDTGKVRRMSGRELAGPVSVAIRRAPGSALWTYQRRP